MPLATLVDSVVKVAPLVVNHQGQFPSVTISFNLMLGTAIGQAVGTIQQVEKQLGKPLSLQTSFRATRRHSARHCRARQILIVAALFVIYSLGVLYESLIHPITIISTLPSAGLGALLLLMAVFTTISVIAIVGIILLIGIVKKNGIMLVDFALHVEHSEGLTARGINLPGLRDALPTNSDDHDGGTAWRRTDDVGDRGRLGTPPARSVTPSSAVCWCRNC